ncbi:MAG: hypothetical protein AAF602_32135, partial [Myxococcota bacterium]
MSLHEVDELTAVLHDAWLAGRREEGADLGRELARVMAVAEVGADRDGAWLRFEVEGVAHRMRWAPDAGLWVGEAPVSRDLQRAVLGSEVAGEAPATMTWATAWAFCRRLAVSVPIVRPRLPTLAEAGRACRGRGVRPGPRPEWCLDHTPLGHPRGGGRALLAEDGPVERTPSWPDGGLRLVGGPPAAHAPGTEEHALAYMMCFTLGIVARDEAIAWLDGVIAHTRTPGSAMIEASLDGDFSALVGKADQVSATRLAITELLVAREVWERDLFFRAVGLWELEDHFGIDDPTWSLH